MGVVDGYQILEQVGMGGMGTVYRALDVRLQREVALKVLHIRQDPASLERFRREGAALARIDHPNVLTVLSAGVAAGKPYLVLPFIRGQTLQGKIDEGEIPIPDVIDLGIALSDAMAQVHDAGISHRDLKPENVLLDTRGRPKITDFGLARGEVSNLSVEGRLLGTPGYWSPEQASGSRDQGPSCDVYGLGATLYALLTGEPPYTSDSLVGLLAAMTEPVRPPSSLRPQVPRELEEICLRCLARDPSERLESMRALNDALCDFKGQQQTQAEASRLRWGRAIALAVAVVAVAVGAYLWQTSHTPTRTAKPIADRPKRLDHPWPAEVGKPYPDLALVDPTNGLVPFSLTRLRGKVVVLNLVATTMPPSVGLSGGPQHGAFRGVVPPQGLDSILANLQALKVANHEDLVIADVLLYRGMRTLPDPKEALEWHKHFGYDKRPNLITLLAADKRIINAGPLSAVPSLHLIDRRHILRKIWPGPTGKGLYSLCQRLLLEPDRDALEQHLLRGEDRAALELLDDLRRRPLEPGHVRRPLSRVVRKVIADPTYHESIQRICQERPSALTHYLRALIQLRKLMGPCRNRPGSYCSACQFSGKETAKEDSFRANLLRVDWELKKSLSLDDAFEPALSLAITINSGLRDLPATKRHFLAAVAYDELHWDAYARYLRALQPVWGGSHTKLMAFALEHAEKPFGPVLELEAHLAVSEDWRYFTATVRKRMQVLLAAVSKRYGERPWVATLRWRYQERLTRR